ncbi:MAG: AI-2E family transporter [Desulfobacterales bacterium]|nr:AI-2E family transporter [Desulfobacterales bacterium]MCP4161611.1 AI-2E family transporter [Deltaproteobacteria bacterium]
MLKKSSNGIILWFFLTLLLISFILLLWLFNSFISSLIMAAVITGIFYPLYERINKQFSNIASSIITCTIVFFILFVPTAIVITILSKEVYSFYVLLKTVIAGDQLKIFFAKSSIIERANYILSKFNMQITPEDLTNPISEYGKVVGLFLIDQARYFAENTVSIIAHFFLMILVIFYLLIDGQRLMRFIEDLSPLPDDEDELVIRKFFDMGGAILIGNGLCGLIQGVLGGFVFAIFNIPSSFLWGVIMCFLAFLPIVGIGVVFLPTSLILFLSGRYYAAIFFLLFYFILSGGIEYIFKPRFVGKRIKMHTLMVFLSIMGGLNLFGILGIIYGPLIATFFLTLTDLYHQNYNITLGTERSKNSLDY